MVHDSTIDRGSQQNAVTTPNSAFRTVAVIGMGLMGGSLGLALKQQETAVVRVTGYARRDETRRLAMKMRAVDAVYEDPCEAVREAELVVLCTPILDIPALISRIAPALMPGAIVTDVGSTKAMLTEEVSAILSGTQACFVGSHPMAGSERAGMEAAQCGLYEKAVVIVTPSVDAASAAAVGRVSDLWRSVGASVITMDAGQHDAIVAGTSHVPHLVAALLVRAAARTTTAPGPYCGPGFRDSTRIASGSELVWHDIVKSNAGPIHQCLLDVRADLDALLALLHEEDYDAVRDLLGQARVARGRILASERDA